MSTVKANNYYDASGGSNAQLYGVASPPSGMGFRNRIINGDMRIDQRNAGASVTANDAVYPVDRFILGMTQSSKGTVQRSTVAPTGFTNSVLFTSSSAYSVLSTDVFAMRQMIEGFNFADLGFGTASAATVTLSFWVRSSLTGTFGGALANGAANRSYPFSYTISAANTWEQKTVTIPGDTTGTWPTDNSAAARVYFSFGMGSNFSGTAGAWAGADYRSVTGATSVVGTNGATFYITGVQLEAGTVASPFERRDYGRELMMCQRYYEKSYEQGTVPGTSSSSTSLAFVYPSSSQTVGAAVYFKVSKRATPTVTSYDQTGNSGKVTLINNGHNFAATQNAVSTESWSVQGPNGQSNGGIAFHYVAAIEL